MTPSPLLAWRDFVGSGLNAEDLDREALAGIEAAEADPRIAAFVAEHGGPLWGALGLYAGRAFRRADGIWEPREKGDSAACLMLPVLGCTRSDPAVVALAAARNLRIAAEKWHVIDILAIDPDGENPVSSLTGNFEGVLGRWYLGLGDEPQPLRCYRSPFDWLHNALVAEADASTPEPVCLAWPKSDAVRQILLHAVELIADDDGHAEELQKAIRAARKAALPPPPRVLVAVDDAVPVEAAA